MPDLRDVLTGDESNLLLYQDSLWGEEDGVFKVALPNGTYEIRVLFLRRDRRTRGD